MQERPILERKNIPIASLLRTPSIRKEIHSICHNQCVDEISNQRLRYVSPVISSVFENADTQRDDGTGI